MYVGRYVFGYYVCGYVGMLPMLVILLKNVLRFLSSHPTLRHFLKYTDLP
jgi:hypothetical protein